MKSDEYITLKEIFDSCHDWEDFCKQEGCPIDIIAEGGGHVTVLFSEKKWNDYGFQK